MMSKSKDKYFVYSCRRGMTCGGWGDRQKGIIAVYLMANATNKLQKRYQQFVATRVAGKKLVCAQIRIGPDPNNADFHGPETDKTCDAFKKVILDQHILSTGDVLVTSWSGIGRHAAYVRGKESGLYCFFEGQRSKSV
ncbi:uncharacterized protein LOC130012122 [Patella vulgata]|uniref:uncharacterized protein LOC130012122 n=1 Tax=Patella vulgata TaxID=6465 RepID=UPI0024A87912|nr:uncharacterized protein LOC130012122 [Patella vulgata]